MLIIYIVECIINMLSISIIIAIITIVTIVTNDVLDYVGLSFNF